MKDLVAFVVIGLLMGVAGWALGSSQVCEEHVIYYTDRSL